MRILILCTGNSCRSQMAEGFLKSFDPTLEVFSAGTHPASKPNPYAVEVMREAGIDISSNQPKNVDLFVDQPFDYVITVCDGAKEVCPFFTGKVNHRLHIGFEDPADATGNREEILLVYRKIRDLIHKRFSEFYQDLKNKLDLKDLVKQKYSEIASQSKAVNQSSCCGCGPCCGEMEYTVFSEDYTGKEGYNPDADLGLGCGIPPEFAGIRNGDHVLDLGSGAGNDCFVAREQVGASGQVIGLDFTDAMIEKARENNRKMGFINVEFVKGDIEAMPFPDDRFDVILSNCVLNLVPNKEKAFKEIFRVMKPGGHFCISDVVLRGVLPEALKKDAELYAGCVSGAIDRDQYTAIIRTTGFREITIHKEKSIELPESILDNYLSTKEIQTFKTSDKGIVSITLSARKYADVARPLLKSRDFNC